MVVVASRLLRCTLWKIAVVSLFVDSHLLTNSCEAVLLVTKSFCSQQASLARLHSQLTSHNITDQSSESDVRVLNTMMDELTNEKEEEKTEEEELIFWIKSMRQIMVDVG